MRGDSRGRLASGGWGLVKGKPEAGGLKSLRVRVPLLNREVESRGMLHCTFRHVPDAVGVCRKTPASAVLVGSACAAAVTLKLVGVGRVTGAVYIPLPSIVPNVSFPPATPFTDQFTPWLEELCTVAVNCCVCGGAPFKFGYRVVTEVGLTETLITGGGGLEPPPPPPQATRSAVSSRARQSPRTWWRRGTLPSARPTSTTLASGRLRGSHKRGFLTEALRTRAGPFGGLTNGPFVIRETWTVVAGEPELIEVGLNPQETVKGSPEHVKMTLFVNVLCPAGVIVIEVVALWPGETGAGSVRVAGTVKSKIATVAALLWEALR